MSPQSPSIQSFFQPEIPTTPTPTKGKNRSADTGAGFSEVDPTLKPQLHRWQPRCAYNELNIDNLDAGPGCIMVVGRVVNMSDEKQSSNMPHTAKGHLKLIVKDDTGALSVRLPLHLSDMLNNSRRLNCGMRKSITRSIWVN